jgi:hypothetical protein
MRIEPENIYQIFHVLDEVGRLGLYAVTAFRARTLRSIEHKDKCDCGFAILAQPKEQCTKDWVFSHLGPMA